MEEKIKMDVKGWLILKGIDSKGNEMILYNDHNTLTGDAKEILTYILAGESWGLNKIKVLKNNVELASNTNLSHVFPTTDSVQFSCMFSETDFNDTLDELQLISQSGKIFSKVSSLNVFKDNTVKLMVTWKLTIN